ncbi:MAG: hypothetical protein ABR992_11285 [Solirubrobacteraceae bacterium]|jgi:hypothetical protein
MGGASATQSFFQLAVAAIPALLFGGAVLDSRRHGKREGPLQDGERVFAKTLLAIVVLAGFAELVAVRGAVDGSIGGVFLDYVAFVLCAGTLALAVNIVLPWGTELWPRIGSSDRWKTRGARLVVVVGGVGLVIGLLVWVHAGVSRAQYSQNVAAAFTSFVAATQEQSTSYDQTATARETALTFVAEHAWAFTLDQRATLDTQLRELVDQIDQLSFKSHKPPGETETKIGETTETMIKALESELGGPDKLPTVLITIVADEVKTTGVAYVKAVDAKTASLQVLRTACNDGSDPRCSKRTLAAQSG